jgi:prevent-host-death family protein
MRRVQASEAKTHLLKLLDAVERGECVVITRRGQPIARLVPEHDHRRADIDRIIRDIETVRKRIKPMTRREIREAIDEGRR